MISKNELREHDFGNVTVNDPEGIITLQNAKKFIIEGMKEYGITVEVRDDEIKSGSVFKSSTIPCIVIVNPEHSTDYYRYCITVSKQGNVAFVKTYLCGYSTLAMELQKREAGQGSFLGRVINSFSKSIDEEVEAEQGYYTILNTVLQNVMQ